MGLIGILLTLATLGFAGMMGYEANLQPVILALLPLGVMMGIMIQRGAKSSRIFQRSGFGVLVEIVVLYITCLVTVGIAFGIGWGVREVLQHRPPPGSGSGW